MLTDSNLRSAVDALWDKLWSGGLSNPLDAIEQLRHYVTEIAKRQSYPPSGFMTNGHQTWFWEVGQANPRVVAGFFSPKDLERLLFLRQNGQTLPSVPINTNIVDRPYQHEAIRRVVEAFAANKHRALLLMATGTGKTRSNMDASDSKRVKFGVSLT